MKKKIRKKSRNRKSYSKKNDGKRRSTSPKNSPRSQLQRQQDARNQEMSRQFHQRQRELEELERIDRLRQRALELDIHRLISLPPISRQVEASRISDMARNDRERHYQNLLQRDELEGIWSHLPNRGQPLSFDESDDDI